MCSLHSSMPLGAQTSLPAATPFAHAWTPGQLVLPLTQRWRCSSSLSQQQAHTRRGMRLCCVPCALPLRVRRRYALARVEATAEAATAPRLHRLRWDWGAQWETCPSSCCCKGAMLRRRAPLRPQLAPGGSPRPSLPSRRSLTCPCSLPHTFRSSPLTVTAAARWSGLTSSATHPRGLPASSRPCSCARACASAARF